MLLNVGLYLSESNSHVGFLTYACVCLKWSVCAKKATQTRVFMDTPSSGPSKVVLRRVYLLVVIL